MKPTKAQLVKALHDLTILLEDHAGTEDWYIGDGYTVAPLTEWVPYLNALDALDMGVPNET